MVAGRYSDHVFKYGGHIGTHMIIGGYDCLGPQLIQVSEDGNFFSSPYHTMGSGCLAAMAVIESEYKDGLTKEQGIDIVVRAIEAGIYHDLGSGSNVDCCVITAGKVEYLRNIKSDNRKIFSKPGGYQFKKDRVQVIAEYKHLVKAVDGGELMEL